MRQQDMSGYKRIFVDWSQVLDARIKLSAADRNYLYGSLRMKPGERVIASDGRRSFLIRLGADMGGETWADIERQIGHGQKRVIDLSLAFGCVRPDPMEQIFRHCAELGVTEFIPILFARCNRRPQEKKTRWEKIIASACSQSGRVEAPSVRDPMTLEQFWKFSDSSSRKILLGAGEGAQPLFSVLETLKPSRLTVMVGPEGGLTADEMSNVMGRSFVKASLNTTILRTETAAIVGVGVVMLWAMEEFSLQ